MNLPLIDNCLFLDNTTLEKFTTCPRSAEYYTIHKRDINRSSDATNYGSAIHEALAAHYIGSDLPSQHAALLKWFASNPQTSDDCWRTPDLAVELVTKYNKNYPGEVFEVIKTDEGKPMVELPFAIPLGKVAYEAIVEGFYIDHFGNRTKYTTGIAKNFEPREITIVWTGRIDALVCENNMTFVLDHKTTSQMGAGYFDEFENSSQMLGYMWAAQHLLKSKVHGVIINALCTRKPTKTGKGIEFQRNRIFPDSDRITEWHHDTLTIVSDFIMMAQRNYFPMHRKWCVGKYGKCPYYDVCTLPASQREQFIASDLYKDVTWSPLNKQ